MNNGAEHRYDSYEALGSIPSHEHAFREGKSGLLGAVEPNVIKKSMKSTKKG